MWQQAKGWVEVQHYPEMQPAAAWGDDLMITHKTWVDGPVRVFNFSVEHTPSYFAGQDSLWVHNANGECKYVPRGVLDYTVGEDIDVSKWKDIKPKGPEWRDVPVNNVTKVTRVAEGIRLEMKPKKELRDRLGLSENDRISIIYDENGNPDFNTLKKADGTLIDVTPDGGKVQIDYAPLDPKSNSPSDIKNAKDKARKEDYFRANTKLFKENPDLARQIGAVDSRDNPIKDRPSQNDSDGQQKWVWHHSPDGKGMELVDFKVHELFKHSGGRSAFDNSQM